MNETTVIEFYVEAMLSPDGKVLPVSQSEWNRVVTKKIQELQKEHGELVSLSKIPFNDTDGKYWQYKYLGVFRKKIVGLVDA